MKLKSEDLRDTKDFLVESIAEQAKQIGILPNVEAHERFVEPILRQVEVDLEEQGAQPIASPADEPAEEPEGEDFPDDMMLDRARRIRWRYLRTLPEWRRLFELVMVGLTQRPHLHVLFSGYRLNAMPETCPSCAWAELEWEKIYQASIKAFGDPAVKPLPAEAKLEASTLPRAIRERRPFKA